MFLDYCLRCQCARGNVLRVHEVQCGMIARLNINKMKSLPRLFLPIDRLDSLSLTEQAHVHLCELMT